MEEPSLLKRFMILFGRQNKIVYRDKVFSTVRILQAVIMGLIFGTIFLDVRNTLQLDPTRQLYG